MTETHAGGASRRAFKALLSSLEEISDRWIGHEREVETTLHEALAHESLAMQAVMVHDCRIVVPSRGGVGVEDLTERRRDLRRMLRRDTDDQERDELIRAATRGNPEMELRIRRLLLAHRRAQESESHVTPPLLDDDIPESIGPYRILERVGRGGMGEVFLAEQDKLCGRALCNETLPRRT